MSKRGREQNKARRAASEQGPLGLTAWQALTVPLPIERIPEVLEDHFRLFVLDAQDRPTPVYEAFPGAMGLMFIGCLDGDPRTVYSHEGPLTFRLRPDDGYATVEFVGHDAHSPLLIAEGLTPEMRAQIELRAQKAEQEMMSGE